jgi:hypothetical protein
LLDRTLSEQKAAHEKLTQLAEAGINQEAGVRDSGGDGMSARLPRAQGELHRKAR